MENIPLIFDFVYNTIREYLLLLNSNWYTQIFLYTIVLSFVVSTILILRGR